MADADVATKPPAEGASGVDSVEAASVDLPPPTVNGVVQPASDHRECNDS